ncbi:MAG: signal recognition particle-docking protein FtsY [Bacteroidales bacterium]|nr:signal recognition particle-docking protein FtsY [Bacteroidales bacterium]
MGIFGFFSSKEKKKETLDKGLEKTKEGLFDKIRRAALSRSTVDEDFLDELEEIFVSSDVGVETSIKIIDNLKERVARDKYVGTKELYSLLYDVVADMMADVPGGDGAAEGKGDFDIPEGKRPYIVLVVGVNGVGKTTTIGKLAAQYKAAGHKVILGAADTFRAAAIEQLEEWARRADVEIVKQKLNSDAASVAHDAVASALAKDADVVLIDTAGRLHNKVGLMNELSKIKRVIEKLVPGAPHSVLLVLDGSTGQNAIEQTREFSQATEVTDLAITKLDGTAKGGVVIGISDQFKIPVRYIGLGEKIEDLQVFDKHEFVKSLFEVKE